MDDAVWIWKDYSLCKTRLVFFRKGLSLDDLPDCYRLRISADSRYKLYVNGAFICAGPCRSSYKKYYDSVDIARYLRKGNNMVAIEAVHYSGDAHDALAYDTGPTSIISTMRGGLYVLDSETGALNTNAGWKVFEGGAHKLKKSLLTSTADFIDDFYGPDYPHNWRYIDFNEDDWNYAVEILENAQYFSTGLVSPWRIAERPIPLPYLKPLSFKRIMRSENIENMNQILDGKEVTINPHTTGFAELDIGYYTNAEIRIKVLEGQGSKIEVLYGECYGKIENGIFVKSIRDDCSPGQQLYGDVQTIICGSGKQEYIPYGYKTFRFMRLAFATGDCPLVFQGVQVLETGYPIRIEGKFHCNNESYNKLWDISLRTLKCCMYETFMDCPYFERLQYLMDTSLQMSYVYRISGDMRLVKKAIADFADAQFPDGIMPCTAPSSLKQVIPGFMFYYVYMLYDYYIYTGDIEFIKPYFPVVEKLFNYFINCLNAKGLIENSGFWQYVDWVDVWKNGSPIGTDGVNVIYSMMMIKALDEAGALYRSSGRDSSEYELLANKMRLAVHAFAFDENTEMYDAGGGIKTQHAQVWAVLSDVISGDDAVRLMKRTMEAPDISVCSYSMSFFLFRALEKTGLYTKAEGLFKKWTRLLPYNITTLPEDDLTQRSDCHAWSAVMLYEFPTALMGIKPLEPGFKKVLIEPKGFWLTDCECETATPIGIIKAGFTKRNKVIKLEISLPELVETLIKLPDGSWKLFFQKSITLEIDQ